MAKEKIILVGVAQDDGSIKHVKGYTNPTWALKAGESAGEFARYATVEADFSSTPVAAKPPKVVASKKIAAGAANTTELVQ